MPTTSLASAALLRPARTAYAFVLEPPREDCGVPSSLYMLSPQQYAWLSDVVAHECQ